MIKSGFVSLIIFGTALALPVWADETGSELDERFSSCEVLTMRFIPDETGHIETFRGDQIRALLCERDESCRETLAMFLSQV